MEDHSAEELKNQGNEALKAGNVEQAIDLYT
jgi:outer membrane protein assembly factor BamD (BamD/ComL family)